MQRITNGRDPLQSEIREAVRAHAGCQSHVSMRRSSYVSAIAALAPIASIVTPNADALAQACAGDCNGDGTVSDRSVQITARWTRVDG